MVSTIRRVAEPAVRTAAGVPRRRPGRRSERPCEYPERQGPERHTPFVHATPVPGPRVGHHVRHPTPIRYIIRAYEPYRHDVTCAVPGADAQPSGLPACRWHAAGPHRFRPAHRGRRAHPARHRHPRVQPTAPRGGGLPPEAKKGLTAFVDSPAGTGRRAGRPIRRSGWTGSSNAAPTSSGSSRIPRRSKGHRRRSNDADAAALAEHATEDPGPQRSAGVEVAHRVRHRRGHHPRPRTRHGSPDTWPRRPLPFRLPRVTRSRRTAPPRTPPLGTGGRLPGGATHCGEARVRTTRPAPQCRRVDHAQPGVMRPRQAPDSPPCRSM
ncbi:hypothetical protein SUDANB176_00371 [Streptomyces sp. enrichment culture]